MRIDIITLFPREIENFLGSSIVGRAQQNGLVELKIHDLRDWSLGNYKQVDDRPYGGGPGMLLRVDVVVPAIEAVKKENPQAKVVLLTPQGQTFQQKMAEEFSQSEGLILVAGHYEGFDERIREYVDLEISIGDYVLTGGELPAMVLVDSVVRLMPGVLGDDESAVGESFSTGQLDFPQYTRPDVYEGKSVPEVLFSGDHQRIEEWRQEQAEKRTQERRPDLID